MNTSGFKLTSRAALALLAGGAALLWSGDGPVPSGSFISQAEARVGRPATPMSYAGVARRTTRRAVAVRGGSRSCGGRGVLLRRSGLPAGRELLRPDRLPLSVA